MDATHLLLRILVNASFLLTSAGLTQSNEQSTEAHIFGVERHERSARFDEAPCNSRCERLIERSLQRIGFTSHKIETSLKTKLIVHKLDEVCWKFLDYEDCASQCPHSEVKHERLSELLKVVKKRCKTINQGYDEHFQCIHKFHAFLEVRCSSYSKEASARRASSLTTHGNLPRRTVKAELQETCRFLHYHNLCLANTVFYYCPDSKELYNRFTLRDYFLSFIVPQNDRDFSDELLDYCEVFDFQKMAKEVYDKTNPTTPRQSTPWVNTVTFPDDNLYELNVTPPKVMAQQTENSAEIKDKNQTKKPKRVFSSEEDLEDTPPNFFYSSARVTPSMQYNTRTASENTHHYERNRDAVQPLHDEIEFVTHSVTQPVSLDFSFETGDYSYSPQPTSKTTEYAGPDDYSASPTIRITSDGISYESPETTHPQEELPSLGDEVKLDYAEEYDEYDKSYEEGTDEDTEVATISKFGSFFETTKPMKMPEELTTTVSTEPWTRTGTYEEDDFAVTNRLPESTEEPPRSSVDKPLLVGTKVHIKKIRPYGEPSDDEEEENEVELDESTQEDYYPAEQEEHAKEESPTIESPLPNWTGKWPKISISATSNPPGGVTGVVDSDEDDSTDEVTSEPVGPTSTVFVLLGIYTVFFLIIIFVLTLLVLCMLIRSKRQKHMVKVPLYYCERY